MLKILSRVGMLFLAAMFLASCSKSSTGNNGTAPALKAPVFAGPLDSSASAQSNLGCQIARGTAEDFNAVSEGYLGLYAGNGTQSGSSWTWSTTFPTGGTAKWTATSSSSGYDWSLVENGATPDGNFSNWTALNGSESSDGKTGNWTAYYPPSSVIQFQIAWSTDNSGNLTGTVTENDSTGSLAYKFVFTDNADKSGELIEYTGTVKTLDVTWESNGSGKYSAWDDSGNPTAVDVAWS